MTTVSCWETTASNLLKGELQKRGMSHLELKQALENVGVKKSINSINLLLNRGKFSLAFFLQCAAVLDIDTLHLKEFTKRALQVQANLNCIT